MLIAPVCILYHPKSVMFLVQPVIFASKVCHVPVWSVILPSKAAHVPIQSLSCSHPVSHVPIQSLLYSCPVDTVVTILWNGVKRVKLWQFTHILLNGVKWVKLWQLTQSCRACVPTIVLITLTSNSIGGGNIKDTGAMSCAVGLVGIILITFSWKWPGMWHRHCQYTQP